MFDSDWPTWASDGVDFEKQNRNLEAASWEQERQERTKGRKSMSYLLDEGVYRGPIIGHTLGVTPNDKKYFSLVVKLTEQEEDLFQFEEMPVPATREIRIWLSTSAAVERAITTLRHLGYTRPSPDGLDEKSPTAFPFKGQVVTVRVKHGEYQGKEKEEIEVLRRPKQATDAERQDIADQVAPQFASIMNAQLAKASA